MSDEVKTVTAIKLEGTSMRPLFKAGDVVFVSPVIPPVTRSCRTSCRLSRGDCAVYEYEGRTLLHRVLKEDAGGVWLADDAGRIRPHQVPWSAVRGKVVGGNILVGGLPGLVYSKVRTLVCKLWRNLRKAER